MDSRGFYGAGVDYGVVVRVERCWEEVKSYG